MANRLLTELVLNDKNFGSGITVAKQKLTEFKSSGSSANSMLGNLTKGFSGTLGVVTKLIPSIAAATTAMGAFNEMVGSSQTLTDEWGRITETASNCVSQLFTSIASGTFTQFIQGLKDVVQNARDAYDALDNLSTFYAFHNKLMAEFAKRRAKIRAEFKKGLISKEDAKKQLDALEKEEQNYLKYQAKVEKASGDAKLVEYTGSKAGSGWVTPFALMGKDGQAAAKKEANKMQKIMDSVKWKLGLMKGAKALNDYIKSMGYNLNYIDFQKRQAALQKYAELSDDKCLEIADHYANASRAEETFYNNQAKDVKITGSNSKSGTSSKSGKNDKVEVPVVPVIKPMDFSALNDDFEKWGEKWAKKIQEGFENKMHTEDLSRIVGRGLDSMNTTFDDSVSLASADIAQKSKDTEAAWNGIASLIDTAGGAMQNLNNKSAQTTGIIAQTIATIAMAYAQSLAKEASSANIWYFIAASAAAMTSMATTIASIHKSTGYANGGIVGGNSYNGDRLIANVNSGEMILNSKLQANLWREINNPSNSSNSLVNGEVEFKIKGQTLVGVQKNYYKKQSRL